MKAICGAKTKNGGKPCQKSPCKNGRCHLHGGKSTGPKTEEGRLKSRLAVTKHGFYSRESKAERSKFKTMLKSIDMCYSSW